jgi:hypothetical protein
LICNNIIWPDKVHKGSAAPFLFQKDRIAHLLRGLMKYCTLVYIAEHKGG